MKLSYLQKKHHGKIFLIEKVHLVMIFPKKENHFNDHARYEYLHLCAKRETYYNIKGFWSDRKYTYFINSICRTMVRYWKKPLKIKGERKEELLEFLSLTTIQSWDESAGWEYAKQNTFLKKNGIMIGNMDLLIASHARSLKATLLQIMYVNLKK